MKTINLQISGMHCASCSTIIERAIKKLPEVKEASVNFSTSNALVTYEDSLSIEQIIKAIESKG